MLLFFTSPYQLWVQVCFYPLSHLYIRCLLSTYLPGTILNIEDTIVGKKLMAFKGLTFPQESMATCFIVPGWTLLAVLGRVVGRAGWMDGR